MRRAIPLDPAHPRDRVLDAARAAALGVVVVAHSLAWEVGSGAPANVLDNRPALAWVTWLAQPLPVFFAAGAVANLGSWRRHPDVRDFLHRRAVRLLTPALLYATAWTALLLPLSVVVPGAAVAGRAGSQLLWFLGVYVLVVLAVPVTSRWAGRPWPTLVAWLALIAVVDALRWNVAGTLGWLNLLLVWGFCHQAGYALPALRRARGRRLLAGAVVAGGAAVGLAVLGPWSSSLVSYVGDREPSNLSPPTVVVALYGLAQVLLLAAAWPRLERALASDRLYVAVAGLGSRGIGLYLWHLPVVGLVVGAVLVAGLRPAPLGPVWWALHVLGLGVVVAIGWALAGAAGRVERRVVAALAPWRRWAPSRAATATATGLAGLVVLNLSVTGFGTWWGTGMLGLPSSSPLTLALLAGGWWLLARAPARPTAGVPADAEAEPTTPTRGPEPRRLA